MSGNFGPSDLDLNKLSKKPLGNATYIPNFKHLSQVVLKKKSFEYFHLFL